MKDYIVVTSDDLQPFTLSLFEQYWKPLKQKHPNLLVTFFVAPNNQEFNQGKENDISKSEFFKKWFEENKEWCQIECHGYDHTKPPEGLRSKKEQKDLIKKSLEILEPYIDRSFLGFKAPFYRMNEETISVLRELDFYWYSQWWNFTPLKITNKRLPEFVEISTHNNLDIANNPDNIDMVYENIDKNLTKLENLGFIYSSFRNIMKEVMS